MNISRWMDEQEAEISCHLEDYLKSRDFIEDMEGIEEMTTYKAKRINRDGHYKWVIYASANGGTEVIVTNMGGMVPIFHQKPVDVVAQLQKQANENRLPGDDGEPY